MHWGRPLPLFNESLMININDVPGTIEVLALFDTHHLAPDDVEALLRGMEAAVVAAAGDPAAPSRVPAAAPVA
jgi:hypothetical protein